MKLICVAVMLSAAAAAGTPREANAADVCHEDGCSGQARQAPGSGLIQMDLRLQEDKARRGGWDYTAFDKTGPKEGHPLYGVKWGKVPDDAVTNFKVPRLNAEIRKEYPKHNTLWPSKKGYKCDPSDAHYKSTDALWPGRDENSAIHCQAKAHQKFFIFQFKETGPNKCQLFTKCRLIPDSEWTVYESPSAFPVLAQGQLCERRTVPDSTLRNPIWLYDKAQVSTPQQCQQLAERREYKYWAVRPRTYYRCTSFTKCPSNNTKSADGVDTYEWVEGVNTCMKCRKPLADVFKPFRLKGAGLRCTGDLGNVRDLWVFDKQAGQCFASPIKVYWSRKEPCQLEWKYYSESPVRNFYDCYTFPTCEAPELAEGWEVHRRFTAPWPEAAGCALPAGTSLSLSGASPEAARAVCQDRAARLGHGYYQVSGSGQAAACTTASACTGGGGADSPVYGEPADPATAVTCQAEGKIKAALSTLMETELFWTSSEKSGALVHSWGSRSRANVLRAVFHDAQDYNRLMLEDPATRKWARMEVNASGDFGGVDGCIYEPLKRAFEGITMNGKNVDTDDKGAQWLNFNLQRKPMNVDPLRIDRSAYRFAKVACTLLCCKSESPLSAEERRGFCGPSPCDMAQTVNYMDRCMVDTMVLAANLILKEAGGPEVPMVWGRRQGDCRNIFKHVKVPGNLRLDRTGFLDAGLNNLESMHKVVEDFALMGFDAKEMAALMGGHSIGRLHKYTGSYTIRNTVRGFCHDPKQAEPMLADDGTGAWKAEGDSTKWTLEDAPSANRLHPAPEWGMGGVWDTTPDAFDNLYFRDLNGEDIREVNNCCGQYLPQQHGTCYKSGLPQQTKNYTTITGCDVNWCARDNKGMVHTKRHFRDMRIWRLAADWALLENPVSREEVRRFAEDETAFHEAFKAAWTKATTMGYPTTGSKALRDCRP